MREYFFNPEILVVFVLFYLNIRVFDVFAVARVKLCVVFTLKLS